MKQVMKRARLVSLILAIVGILTMSATIEVGTLGMIPILGLTFGSAFVVGLFALLVMRINRAFWSAKRFGDVYSGDVSDDDDDPTDSLYDIELAHGEIIDIDDDDDPLLGDIDLDYDEDDDDYSYGDIDDDPDSFAIGDIYHDDPDYEYVDDEPGSGAPRFRRRRRKGKRGLRRIFKRRKRGNKSSKGSRGSRTSKKSTVLNKTRVSHPRKNVPKNVKQMANISANTVKEVPGLALTMNKIRPFLLENGEVDAPPTNALIEGASLQSLLNRYETLVPGTSITKSGTSTGVPLAITIAQADIVGDAAVTPVLIFSHQASVLNANAGTRYTVQVEFDDELGASRTITGWQYRRKDTTKEILVYFFFYVEVASRLYPVLAKVDVTSSIVTTFTNVPADEVVSVIYPGMNHAQYLTLMKKLRMR